MDQLDIQFKTEASCQLALEELEALYNPEWGHNIIGCIKVDNR